MSVGGVDIPAFGKKLYREYSADDVGGLAAELTYHYFLALFPFLIFLAAFGGFIAKAASVDDPTSSVMNAIGGALPADANSVLETQVRGVLEHQSAGLLSIGIIGALWAASGAMKSMIKAINRAYDVPETRSLIATTALAIGMTLAATTGLLGSAIVFALGTAWGGDVADWLGLGDDYKVVISITEWPLMIALVLGGVAVLYKLAPNVDIPWRFITPGSAMFTVVWLIATVAFGLYVANFGSYNKTYGALGGVVVLLTWLYLTNLMLLLGAEINALLDQEKDPEATKARRDAVIAKAAHKQTKRIATPGSEDAPGARPPAIAPEVAPTALAPRLPAHIAAATNANGHRAHLTQSDLVRTVLFGGVVAVAAFGLKRARE